MDNEVGGVTVGELNRTLVALRGTLNDISLKFDAYVLKEVHELEMRAIRNDMNDVQENLRWVVRTLVAAVITAIVAYLFAATQGGPS